MRQAVPVQEFSGHSALAVEKRGRATVFIERPVPFDDLLLAPNQSRGPNGQLL
jgi:hypothetical protein